MIRKYSLKLVDGEFQARGKLTKKAIADLKAGKSEIMAMLKKAEQEKIALKTQAEKTEYREDFALKTHCIT